MVVSKECVLCFDKFKTDSRFTNHKYCKKCTTSTCEICNSSFSIKPKAKSTKKYCGRDCFKVGISGRIQSREVVDKIAKSNTGRKTGIFIRCTLCKKEKYIFPYLIKKIIGNFCNATCFVKWTSGSLNPKWKGDSYPENKRLRQSFKYRQWRKSVFLRDNFSCVLCQYKSKGTKPTDINADHIKAWYLYPKHRFEISNGRTLCLPCHCKTESYGLNQYTKLASLTQRGLR